MSHVLLVDTNLSSGPIYRFLAKTDHRVTVVGGNPNDALAKCVDDYLNVDYSDVEKMRRLIEEHKIDYLVPGCNDRSYMVCSEINADRRFPGIDPLATAEIINNKEKFRSFSSKHGLPAPQVLGQDEIGTRWPVIVKPVDAFSGRGVTIIHEFNKDFLSTAISRARDESKSGAFIIEDYVEGQLNSHTAFIQNGDVLIDCIVEEHGTANPFTVDTSRVVYDFSESMLESIRADIRLLAQKLDLQDGLLHTQFISNGEQYWLIEITRRCPGDLYSQLIELSTGLNYAENYARPFVGMPFDIQHRSKRKWVMRHTLTQSMAYTLGSISFDHAIKLINWIPISQTGDKLGASPQGRIAIMFAEESDAQALDDLFQLTLRRQLYQVRS